MRNVKEVIINGVNLEEILEKHEKWLNNKEGGEKANLSYADLTNANLRCANLIYADLTDTNLSCANLSYADLKYANLSYANLRGANLNGANLNGADLNGANLKDVKYNEYTSFFALQCPEEGSFVGYKKASGKIVKLLIMEDSKRSSATSRKCRCSKAKVLSITNIENTEEYDKVTSDYYEEFIYKVGKIVEVKGFDDDRWEECSTGIHFFLTRDEAVRY